MLSILLDDFLMSWSTARDTSRRNAFIENVVFCVVHVEEKEKKRNSTVEKNFDIASHKAEN